ncbi:MAG: hypothetical protein ACTSO3_12510, partial [Candidatus Heimdallarchaeaceae archaeon]
HLKKLMEKVKTINWKKVCFYFLLAFIIGFMAVLIDSFVSHGYFIFNWKLNLTATIGVILIEIMAFFVYSAFKSMKSEDKNQESVRTNRESNFELMDKLVKMGISRNIAQVLVKKVKNGDIQIKTLETVKFKGYELTTDILVKHINGTKTAIISYSHSVKNMTESKGLINILSRLTTKDMEKVNIKLLTSESDALLTFKTNLIKCIFIHPNDDEKEIAIKLLGIGNENTD